MSLSIAGYSIAAGYFVAGDIDGDGKVELIHIVSGTDYVNIWKFKSDGAFNVKLFRPWPNYWIGGGYFLGADVDGDGKTELIHVVAGTDYVNIWRAASDGWSFDVKPFSPWAGYSVAAGYFVGADIDGAGNTELIHIVSGTDYVNVWKSKTATAFSVVPFNPWPNYWVAGGYFLAGDFNKDGKADLVHIVATTDYVNIWTKIDLGYVWPG